MYDRFRLLKIFATTAQSDSFRDAAFQLGTSPQTISRAVKELEDQLGELLFHRSTRQIQITRFGERFLHESNSLISEFELLFEGASNGDQASYAGRVGITAPHSVGRGHVLPLLAPLIEESPECLIDLRLEDEVTDTVGAQIDIGIRVGALKDNRFVARQAAEVPLMVVASSDLIRRVGEPRSIADLMTRPVSGGWTGIWGEYGPGGLTDLHTRRNRRVLSPMTLRRNSRRCLTDGYSARLRRFW